jgi:hypothetical protein
MARYLNWLGHPSQIFNVGNYRRNVAGADRKASFFDPENLENSNLRDKIADMCLEDMFQWFRDGEEEEKLVRRMSSSGSGMEYTRSPSIPSATSTTATASPALGPKVVVDKSIVGAARVAIVRIKLLCFIIALMILLVIV